MPLRGGPGAARIRNVGLRNARSIRRRTKTRGSSFGARILILCAAGGLFGCGADAPSDVGTHADLDALPLLELEEALRIGSVEDPDYGFSSIGWLLDLDREGNVYVFEARDVEIRVYSPDGELLRRIGRAGQGPGEFANWTVLGGISGDTLWTFDMGGERLTLFDLEGNVLSTARIENVTAPLATAGDRVRIVPQDRGPDGLFLGDRGSTSMGSGSHGAAEVASIPRVRFGADGRVVDTIGSYPRRAPPEPRLISVRGSRFRLPEPPGLASPWIPTGDGHVIVENEVSESERALRITRLGHSGDTLEMRLLGYQPKAFPDSILEAAATEAAHQVGDTPIRTSSGVEFLERHAEDTAAARSAIRRQMDFPEFQAPVQGHEVGADGSIWLRREDLGAEEHRWAVFGADLDPRGEVRIPRSFRILRVSTDGLWVAESDELGIPWLVHYRLIDG